ncbi:hypothetical protein BGZ73_007164 [Actinomortierella ambigua]|nr:hypothetical protein BGZ73_007164 [Actinomortierella ambigua]
MLQRLQAALRAMGLTFLLGFLLCIFQSSESILVKLANNRPPPHPSSAKLLFLSEFLKLVISYTLLCVERKTVVGLSNLRWRRCKGRCACGKGRSDDVDLEDSAQAMMEHHQLADSEVDSSDDEDEGGRPTRSTTNTAHSTKEKQPRSSSSSSSSSIASSSSVTVVGSPVTPSSQKQRPSDLSAPTTTRPGKGCRFPPILLFAVPGAIYFFNNNLTFVLLSLMPAPTYVVLSNLKILTTGLFSYWFLHRHLSTKQWVSLGLLFLSTALSQIDLDKGITLAISIQAFLLMILFCSLSAAASVFSEYVMKDRFGDESIHLQNMKLYMFGILFNGITYLVTPPPAPGGTAAGGQDGGFFSDMALIHLFVVMAYASLGLVTSAIIKFSGSITKVYASSMSMFFAALVGWLLFSDKLTVLFFVGCVGCCYALHLYNAPSSSSSSSTSGDAAGVKDVSSANSGGLASSAAVDRSAYESLVGGEDEDDYNDRDGTRLEMVVTSCSDARSPEGGR